jgi:multimeric flavodoxin WrbA
MKITIINGSPRKNGATGIILKEMKNILEKKGDVEVSYFEISKNPPKQCTGCMNCYDKAYSIKK